MTGTRTVFRRLRARTRAAIMLEGAALVLAAVVGFALASYFVDRSLRLEAGYRLVLLLILAVVVGRLLQVRLLRPLGLELDDDEMALAVERADPSAKQALISAVQFERALGGAERVAESRVMMSAVVADVERRAASLRARDAVDRRRMRRFAAVLAGAALAAGTWIALDPAAAALWARRNLLLSSVEWPRYTHLVFAVGSDGPVVRVPEGDDLTLVVRAGGVVPEQTFLQYRFAGGATGIEPMTLTGQNEFAFTLQAMLENAVVWATGGDGLTAELNIEVVARPRIEDLQITLVYPAYMRKPDESVGVTEGDVKMPRGGKLQFRAHATKPLSSASLTFGQDRRVALSVENQFAIAGEFEPPDTGLLTLNVIDQDRLDAAQPPQLFLRLGEDRAPAVEFEVAGIGAMVTPIARLPGHLKVRDDYGLREVSAQYQVTGTAEEEPPGEPASPESQPWSAASVPALDAFAPDVVEYQQDVAFDLLPLHPSGDPAAADSPIRPGQQVALRFVAKDNFGPAEPHEGIGDPVVFRVVTPAKLTEDLKRRQEEQRRELEVIVEKERGDLAELREIVSPAAQDPRAAVAKLRVLALSRDQRTLGRRVEAIALTYRQILDEYLNNRILEPGNVAALRGAIVAPMESVVRDGFPGAADAAKDFADSGAEDVRKVVVASYEAIVRALEEVLSQMVEAENFAGVLQDLKETIKLHGAAMREAEKRRREEASGVLDPREGRKDKEGK